MAGLNKGVASKSTRYSQDPEGFYRYLDDEPHNALPNYESVAGTIKPRVSEVAPEAGGGLLRQHPHRLDTCPEDQKFEEQTDDEKKETDPPEEERHNNENTEPPDVIRLNKKTLMSPAVGGMELPRRTTGHVSHSPTPIPDSVRSDRSIVATMECDTVPRHSRIQPPSGGGNRLPRAYPHESFLQTNEAVPQTVPRHTDHTDNTGAKEVKIVENSDRGNGIGEENPPPIDPSSNNLTRQQSATLGSRSPTEHIKPRNNRLAAVEDANNQHSKPENPEKPKTLKSSPTQTPTKTEQTFESDPRLFSKISAALSNIDWKVDVNKESHHTAMYDDQFLIIRRGFPVHFTIRSGTLNRIKFYNIPSKYSTECNTQPPRSMVEVSLTLAEPSAANWRLEKKGERESDEGEVQTEYCVVTSPTCNIGLWLVKVRVDEEDFREDLRILFNPWCPQDEVYLKDHELRQEYVLCENGRVYSHMYTYFPWYFGQFERRILDIVLYLLDKSKLSTGAKCSAVFISRVMAEVVHYDENELNGVINGRWQEPYTGGYDPKHWHSSVDILHKHYKTRRHVSHGQCWVFSALLVTLLRALGIPCRTVTNNVSFHDSNRNNLCEFEVQFDGSVKKLDHLWNFHVWVEAWMRRDDLPAGDYDGWQAIDPTPQEISEGSSRVGPASVKAIREGLFYLPFDTVFLYSEMNSDIVFWKRDRKGQLEKLIKIDSSKIGEIILTKQIGTGKADDLTSSYKQFHDKTAPSLDEKQQIMKAVNPAVNSSLYDQLYLQKSEINLKLHAPDYVAIGSDFEYSLEIFVSEESSSSKQVHACICIFVATNTGKFIGQVAKYDYKSLKLPNDSPVRGKIEYGKYRRFAGGSYLLKIFAMCELKEPKPFDEANCDFCSIPFYCKPPEIKILSGAPYVQGEPVDVRLSFNNEFKFGLSGCYFELSAPRMKSKAFGIKKGLGAGESCYIHLQYKPKRSGDLMLIGKFGCREVCITCGSVELIVAKKERSGVP